MSGTMIPTVWHHMIVSSGQAHADLHLSVEAERSGSAASLRVRCSPLFGQLLLVATPLLPMLIQHFFHFFRCLLRP
jgi:hypothetical protein